MLHKSVNALVKINKDDKIKQIEYLKLLINKK